MRRFFLTLYILSAAVLLSACGEGGVLSSRRDMERLRPVQTLGLDGGEGGVALSVSTGIGPDGGPPLVMSARGAGIESAVSRLQDYSPEDELFYAHVRYLLLGEAGAQSGVLPLLEWVERSPSMRMETPLLLVRGTAAEAVAASTGEAEDVTERLASLEREERTRGRHIHSLREIASALSERGCALCAAVSSEPAEGIVVTASESAADALIPTGWAVLRQDGPPVFLTGGETLGAELLTGGISGARASAGDYVLDIIQGSAEVSGQRDERGSLTGLEVRCRLRAGILEGPPGDEEEAGILLAAEAEAWLRDVIGLSQKMGCDFLDLEDAVWGRRLLLLPGEGAGWEERFSSLPVYVTAEAQVERSYDLAMGGP